MANQFKRTLLNRLADSVLNALVKHSSGSYASPYIIQYQGQTSTRAYKYKTYATEGFQQNAIVFACIRMIYEAAATLEIKYLQDGEIIPDDKLPKQILPVEALMKRPSLYQSFDEWLKQTILFWECSGMAYIYGINLGVVKNISNTGEILNQRTKTSADLTLIRPDRIDILHNAGIITGYRLDGGKAIISPEDMMYVRFPDPMDQFVGMPPMRAAATAIDRSNASGTFSSTLFQNSAKPSGALSFNAPNTTPEQMDNFEAMFNSKYSGPANAGKTIILNTDKLNYKPFSFSPSEMAISEGDLTTMRLICNAFGVPSQMLGDPETSKYSNYEEAQKDFYQNTVIPLVNHLFGELNNWLMPKYNIGDIEMFADFSHISFLNDDKNMLVDRLSKASWLTDNEKRIEMGYEPLDDPDADALKKAQPAGFFSANRKLETRQILDHVSKHSLFRTQESRDAFVDEQDDKRQPIGRKILTAMNEFWAQQEKLLLAWIPGVYADCMKLETRDLSSVDISNFFHTNNQNKLLFDALDDLEFSALATFGQDAMILAGSTVAFNVERPDLRRWLTEGLTERSNLINTTTADRLEILLDKAIKEGVGVGEIKLRIQEKFKEMSKGRALAIARTETGMAQSRATLEGYAQAGTERHEWVSARDSNVRDSHVLLDGEVVEVGQPFSNGGLAPGMSGYAEEDINCRCVTAPLNMGDEPI